MIYSPRRLKSASISSWSMSSSIKCNDYSYLSMCDIQKKIRSAKRKKNIWPRKAPHTHTQNGKHKLPCYSLQWAKAGRKKSKTVSHFLAFVTLTLLYILYTYICISSVCALLAHPYVTLYAPAEYKKERNKGTEKKRK